MSPNFDCTQSMHSVLSSISTPLISSHGTLQAWWNIFSFYKCPVTHPMKALHQELMQTYMMNNNDLNCHLLMHYFPLPSTLIQLRWENWFADIFESMLVGLLIPSFSFSFSSFFIWIDNSSFLSAIITSHFLPQHWWGHTPLQSTFLLSQQEPRTLPSDWPTSAKYH